MNLEEIKKYLQENKDNEEVKAYLQELKGEQSMTVEEMQELVDKDESFKRWFDSQRDKHFNKGLETWKANNLEKLIEEEIKKRYPEDSEEDRKYKELEAKIKQLEAEKTKETLSKKALEFATENNLPTNLITLFVSNDEETTNQYLEQFKDAWNNQVQQVKEQLIKDNGVDPKDSDQPNEFSIEQLQSMSKEEINANWDKIQKALK